MCRVSLGLLLSSDDFFPAAVRAAEAFARRRGLARLVVVNRPAELSIDQAARHSGALAPRQRLLLSRKALALARGKQQITPVDPAVALHTRLPGRQQRFPLARSPRNAPFARRPSNESRLGAAAATLDARAPAQPAAVAGFGC